MGGQGDNRDGLRYGNALICRVACQPSSSGRLISIRMRFGRSLSISVLAWKLIAYGNRFRILFIPLDLLNRVANR